jgi:amino acid transporter
MKQPVPQPLRFSSVDPALTRIGSTTPLGSPVVSESVPAAPNALPAEQKEGSYGLRHGALSPLETLGQSISGVAPTLTPFVNIPLVFLLAGNGTWLAYLLSTVAIVLVAWCIGRFARYSSSPGSLYSYAAMILPPWLGEVAAWSLLLAYVATCASNIGGFYYYGNVMLKNAGAHPVPPLLLLTIMTAAPMWFAWRDVKISARVMLGIEAVSVSMIVAVVALVQWRHGTHIDMGQLRLHGVKLGGFRQGVVLALFSFVGFESATAMGSEARNPLRAIPRAVIQTAILSGIFFTVCGYIEVLGFGMAKSDLASSDVPMHVLAAVGGVPVLGSLLDLGALVSLFAGTLACLTAATRVLLLMAHNGLAHRRLRKTHKRNETPTGAILAAGLAAFVPVAVLSANGTRGLDVFGWMGSLAVYGFVIGYGLVCFALPRYLREHHGVENLATKTIPWIAFAAMIFALVANLYPIPDGAYGKLPYIYLAYLIAVLLVFTYRSRRRPNIVVG